TRRVPSSSLLSPSFPLSPATRRVPSSPLPLFFLLFLFFSPRRSLLGPFLGLFSLRRGDGDRSEEEDVSLLCDDEVSDEDSEGDGSRRFLRLGRLVVAAGAGC